jgi:hypothetical protein
MCVCMYVCMYAYTVKYLLHFNCFTTMFLFIAALSSPSKMPMPTTVSVLLITIILVSTSLYASRGSSVSIVSDYGLGDRGSIPDRAENFSSSLCVQTGSAAHLASCTMVPGVISPGVKCGRGVMLTTHPHLVPRLRMSMSYTSSPPRRLHGM